MQELVQKKRPKSLFSTAFLLLTEENRSDESGELFVGVGVGELCPPTVVEFHEPGMGLVVDDRLGIAAGLFPITTLLFFAGS